MSNAGKGFATGASTGAASGFMVGGAWGAVIGGALGGLSGLMSGGAADKAEELAEMQAKFKERETQENLRRMQKVAAMELGGARAAIGASNVQFSGSSSRYVGAMQNQQQQDQSWYKIKSGIEQRMILKGGQTASSGIMTDMYANQISQLGSSAAGFVGAGGLSGPTDTYSLDQVPAGTDDFNDFLPPTGS
jgi:hypothetical protein